MKALIVFLLLLGCVASPEPEIQLPLGIDADETYRSAYDKATSQYEVIHNFETKFTIQTTLLSSRFRAAFGQRYQNLYNEAQPILTEASQKTGFFVSVYASRDELNSIDDANLWTIQLFNGTEVYRPTKVQKVKDKDRWRPFFENITPWSHEYIILFDAPASVTIDQDLVVAKKARLVLSNQDGRVTITW